MDLITVSGLIAYFLQCLVFAVICHSAVKTFVFFR